MDPLVAQAVEATIAVAVTVAFGWILTRLLREVASKAGASRALIRNVSRLILVVVVLVVVTALAGISGLSSYFTTLTISGIAGLAVSLALQNTLTNVVSGVLIFYDGTVKLGDHIEFGGARGEVVKVGFRSTWVKRDDGAITIISNSSLIGGPITNHSAHDRLERKVDE